MQKQPKWAVFWCSDMMHIMQKKRKKKKCIPVGLYRLLCLKSKGTVNCRAAHVSEPKRLPTVGTSDEREKVSLCNMLFVASTSGPVITKC